MSNPLLPMAKARVLTCTDCWLHTNGNGGVPYRGPSNPSLVVIGGAPDEQEDRERESFVGAGGNWMSNSLSMAGLDPSKVGWMNVVCCFPGKKGKKLREPELEEVQSCSVNLRLQLLATEPLVVILAGSVALNAFRPGLKISKVRGNPFMLPGFPSILAVPTYHPTIVSRTSVLKPDAISDVQQARARLLWIRKGIPLSRNWPERCIECGALVDEYDVDGLAWCKYHLPVDPHGDGDHAQAQLETL